VSDEPERDENGRLLPGHTANPNGRPKKGLSMTDLLSARLDEMSASDAKGGTVGGKEMVVQALIKAALTLLSDKRTEISKDVAMRAVTAIFDRLDGKPAETVRHEGGGRTLRIGFVPMTREELDAMDIVTYHEGIEQDKKPDPVEPLPSDPVGGSG
jgi:hypothetical protein